MPNWNDILNEINTTQPVDGVGGIDLVRRKYLGELQAYTGRNTIAYYSGFLQKPPQAGIEINDDDKNGLMLCIHELDQSAGLDILLHTPGGSISATQSIVHYLRSIFGDDIRAIVPQIAMSGGTMIACACKSIVMGKHSNLGPCDPQVNGIPAIGVRRQFQRAYNEIIEDARAMHVWQPILAQLGPSFLEECDWAVQWAEEFVSQVLRENMFSAASNAEVKATETTRRLTAEENKGHDRHFHQEDCIGFGLNIEILEEDGILQDLVLTTHHAFMHTMANSLALKVIENHLGRAFVKNLVPPQPMLTPILQFGGPPQRGGPSGNF